MTSLQIFLPKLHYSNKRRSFSHPLSHIHYVPEPGSEKDDYEVSRGQLVDDFEGLSKSSWLWASNLVYWGPWP